MSSAPPACRGSGVPVDLKALHAKIGRLTLEDDFLEGAMIDVRMLCLSAGKQML